MELTKRSTTFEGVLSNGVAFSVDMIKRDKNWLFGVNAGSARFYTTSKEFEDAGKDGVAIAMNITSDLVKLGIPMEDAGYFVEALGELVNS